MEKCLQSARWYETIVSKEGILSAIYRVCKSLDIDSGLPEPTKKLRRKKTKGTIPDSIIQEFMRIDGIIDISEAISVLKSSPGNAQTRRFIAPLLDANLKNLVKDAQNGKIDPVIGREEDLNRLIRCLGRRKKRNAIITGDAGTGKTALVEKLALEIHNGNVPEHLHNMPIFSLDIMELTAIRSNKVGNMLADISNSDVIIFIDEIHLLMDQRFYDIAQALKPVLTRGKCRCIGATTRAEYVKHFADDEAFRRRFERIDINEVSYEDAVQILTGLRPLYEEHHKIQLDEAVLRSIVSFSQRYVPGVMPDKCIDLLESVCAEMTTSNRTLVPSLHKNEKMVDFYIRKNQKQKVQIITVDDVKRATEKLTGIQTISDMTYDDILNSMKKLVIGHDECLSQIVGNVVKSHNVYRSQGCLASMLFIGDENSGREHVARSLCKTLYGSTEAMLTIDMAYYDTPHNITRLLGAPPGYIGHETGGGALAKFARSHPSGIIYLQNIGSQDTAVTTIFKKAIEIGKVTDAAGMDIDMRNYIIIGSYNLRESKTVGFSSTNSSPMSVVKFINPQIKFNKLEPDKLRDLCMSYINETVGALKKRGVLLEVDENLVTHISKEHQDAASATSFINTWILDRLDYKDRHVIFRLKDKEIVKENKDANPGKASSNIQL